MSQPLPTTKTDSEHSPLHPVRRVITGHTAQGKSTILRDEVQPPHYWSGDNKHPIYDVFRTERVPAAIDSELAAGGAFVDEIVLNGEHVNPTGSVFRSFEFAPGMVTPFHRTESIDYGVVVKGSIVLELDDGEKVTINEGEVVCQRGTAHAWRNETSEWTRIFFVVLGAKTIKINGEDMKEVWNA